MIHSNRRLSYLITWWKTWQGNVILNVKFSIQYRRINCVFAFNPLHSLTLRDIVRFSIDLLGAQKLWHRTQLSMTLESCLWKASVVISDGKMVSLSKLNGSTPRIKDSSLMARAGEKAPWEYLNTSQLTNALHFLDLSELKVYKH